MDGVHQRMQDGETNIGNFCLKRPHVLVDHDIVLFIYLYNWPPSTYMLKCLSLSIISYFQFTYPQRHHVCSFSIRPKVAAFCFVAWCKSWIIFGYYESSPHSSLIVFTFSFYHFTFVALCCNALFSNVLGMARLLLYTSHVLNLKGRHSVFSVECLCAHTHTFICM